MPHASPGARRPQSGSAGSTEEGVLSAMAPDLILLALENLGEAFPQVIAEATGLSPKTVTNNLLELKRRAKICYSGRTGPGGSKQVALIPALRPKREVPVIPENAFLGELKEGV
jgi:hypothetical protein